MERLYVYRRANDGKQVEFFSTMRAGRLTYLIREQNGQDSVTRDKQSMEDFREQLRRDGFVLVSQ